MGNNLDKSIRQESLDLLRFPLAVIIVIVHVFGSFDTENLPISTGVNCFIDAFLRGQSVPIYYFISGYVFFLGINNYTLDRYKSKLQNRVKTLLIPFIIWNILLVIINLLKRLPILATIFPNIHSVEIDLSISSILNTFWDASKGVFQYPNLGTIESSIFPINSPLWFIRELMIVVMLTPIIFRAIKYIGNYFIAIVGILWIVLPYFVCYYCDQFLTALFFFSFGSIMSIRAKDMVIEFQRLFKPTIIIYPLLCILYMTIVDVAPDTAILIKKLKSIVGLLLAYNVSIWMLQTKEYRVNKFLSSSSFFIYIAHYLVYADVLKILMLCFSPESDLANLSVYMLTVVVTIALLLLVFAALKRFSPYVLGLITGRR